MSNGENEGGRPGHLGKREFQPSPKDFKLADFLAPGFTWPSLRLPFGHANLFGGDDWLMFGNGPDNSVRPGFSGCGDCVYAMIAHIIKAYARLHRRVPPKITGKTVVGWYSDGTGYVLDDNSTDQGTYVRDALNHWRTEGFVDDDGKVHKIAAFFQFDAQNPQEALQAAWAARATLIGFAFQAAQGQQFYDGLWDYVPGSPNEGGHAVPLLGAKTLDDMGLVSWARRVGCTRAFLENLNDESWAVISQEDFNRSGLNERGLDYDKVNDALGSLH